MGILFYLDTNVILYFLTGEETLLGETSVNV